MRATFFETPSQYPGLCYYCGTPQLLWQEALRRAGCEVSLLAPPTDAPSASEPGFQDMRAAGERLAAQLLEAYRADPARSPEVWLTAGICPHAPDWVGLRVSRELAIPYVLVEPQIGVGTSELATLQEKESAKNAVKAADATVTTRSRTARGLLTLLNNSDRLTHVLPFLDLAPSLSASHLRDTSRNELVGQLGMPRATACLVTDGPQEPGQRDAWQMFALALSRIVLLDWHVLVLGRGSIEGEVHEAMRRLPAHRVHYWPNPSGNDRMRALAGSDLYVWPATNEVGLSTLLEAQATGTPVIACRDNCDATDRMVDGQTGRLSTANAESLANDIGFLLRHPIFLASYAKQARETAATRHDIRVAAETLRWILARAVSATDAKRKEIAT